MSLTKRKITQEYGHFYAQGTAPSTLTCSRRVECPYGIPPIPAADGPTSRLPTHRYFPASGICARSTPGPRRHPPRNHPASRRRTGRRPDQATPVHLLLVAICEELGIEVDFARLPDIFLGPDEDPPEPEAAAPLPPNPCATSPP
jgi:hypothetical protein